MKKNTLGLRFSTVLTILVASSLALIQAGGQEISSSQVRIDFRSGPVSRELALARRPVASFSVDFTGARRTLEKVDRCIETSMNGAGIPGASVAIIENGAFVYEKAYGVKHRDQGGAVTTDTVFRFGSTLKMMTAAAVMQQVELGRVNLNAPVTQYVPEFQVAGPWPSSTITVWNLLTHTTSFPDRYDQDMFRNGLAGPTTPTALSDWAGAQSNIPLYAPPGSFWNYSNPNFSLAGLIAERSGGLPYNQYMKERVWGPAGMTSATMLPSDVLAYGDYAYEHYEDIFTGEDVIAAPDAYDNWVMGPAGLGFATARDLARFALILMNGGSPILSPASAEMMQSPLVDTQTGEPIFYGFGVMVLPEYFGANLRMHGGNVFGSSSSLIWAPDFKFAISLLYNGAASPDDAAMCVYRVFHPFTDGSPPDDTVPPSEWGKYAGNYRGRYYGHWDYGTGGEIVTYDGLEITATTVKRGNRLVTRIPELNVDRASLIPIGLDNFVGATLIPPAVIFGAGYLDDSKTLTPSNFIVNRQFVLIREPPKKTRR